MAGGSILKNLAQSLRDYRAPMANLNKVYLIGNLTRDQEIRYTPKGTAVADTAIAINRIYKGEDGEKKEGVTFIDLTFWGRQAEIAQEYLRKGRPVFIEGRLQLDTWDDRQTGQKRSRLRVIAENLQMLGSRDRDGATPSVGSSQRNPPSQDPDLDAQPDDIPF